MKITWGMNGMNNQLEKIIEAFKQAAEWRGPEPIVQIGMQRQDWRLVVDVLTAANRRLQQRGINISAIEDIEFRECSDGD